MGESMGPSVEGAALLAASMDGIGIVEDGRIVRANGELAATFGYEDPSALVGLSWRDLHPAAECDRIESEVLPRVREGTRWRGEVEGRRADGTRLPTVLSVSEGDGGRLVWVVREGGEPADRDGGTREPTAVESGGDYRIVGPGSGGRSGTNAGSDLGSVDRERSVDRETPADANGDTDLAPGQLRAGADETGPFRRLIEASPVPIWVQRMEEIVFLNDAAAAFYGADDPEEIVGRSDLEFVVPEERERSRARNRRIIEDGEVLSAMEGRKVDLEGRVRHGLFAAAPIRFGGEDAMIVVGRDITERKERERELRRQRTLIEGILNTIPDVVFAFDESGDPIVEEAMLDEFAGYGADELADRGPMAAIPEDERATALERIRRVLVDGETVSYRSEIEHKDGKRVPHEFRAAPLELDGEVLGVVGSARDVTERLERERALERRRDELETLYRINELLLETARELIQTSSREAVYRTVCERLASSELYRFAWVGRREFDGDRIVARASAGEADGYLDAVTITDDRSDTGQGPAGRAMRTGEVQVANVADDAFEPWREQAAARGFESVAAVPLHHDDTVYGVLVVYATREDAFSPREQDGFDVLGRTVGFVVHAARSREQLFADAVVELEFALADDSILRRTAADLDCDLSLDGYVAAAEGWLLYMTVAGTPAAAVVDAVEGDDDVERARVVGEGDDGGRIELKTSASVLLATVTAAGGTARTAEIDADGTRVVIEAPADAEVRDVLEPVFEEYPGSELVAQRERDRRVTTVGRPGGPLDALTDRQREILEAAYRAGYYAWPRESTAEEVAEAVDISSPTLHGHLRKAEEAILTSLFESPDA